MGIITGQLGQMVCRVAHNHKERIRFPQLQPRVKYYGSMPVLGTGGDGSTPSTLTKVR